MEITEQEVQLAQEINDTVNRLNKLVSKAISLGLKVVHDVKAMDITRVGERETQLLDFDIRVYKEIE